MDKIPAQDLAQLAQDIAQFAQDLPKILPKVPRLCWPSSGQHLGQDLTQDMTAGWQDLDLLTRLGKNLAQELLPTVADPGFVEKGGCMTLGPK